MTESGAHDNGANRAICAGNPIPYGKHENRAIQTQNSPESRRQIHRIQHRPVDDPQPDPSDVLSFFRLRFPGKEKVVPIDRGDGEVVLPLVRRSKAQAKISSLVGAPTPNSKDRFEERHQIR